VSQVTGAPPTPDVAREARSTTSFAAGSAAFTVVLSMAIAVTALAIDSLLPAFPEIREHLGLASDSTAVAGLVTAFLVGNGLGLVPAGLLADRFGRRQVMWGGLALYVLGAVGSVFAPTLGVMLAARFVWGLGAAGPRVAALAIVRDVYSGDQMARQMSLIMSVFILVPTVAPALGAGLIAVGPWHLVFWMCAAAAALVLVASIRLPSTIAPEDRRALTLTDIVGGWKIVVTTPGTLGYLTGLTVLFGAFLSYLASSEIIVDEVFGLEQWFPLIFGVLAAVMGVAMFVNGRIVMAVGLDRLIWLASLAYVASTTANSQNGGLPPVASATASSAAVEAT
jgi:DHA1 family bicyclomycin/chloramphenicol resistance-like MFS transporter